MAENGTAIAVKPNHGALRAGSRGLMLTSIDDMWRFATAVSKSGLAPKGLSKPEQILIALEYGAELGLKPMQAMATVMVVNGRATLWGDGMLAVAQASGLLEDIKETFEGDPLKPDTMAATCTVKRKGRPSPSTCKFGWKEARQAALTGRDTYKQYPQRMLKFRARAFALRDAFPDVLCGVYSSEEAADFPDAEPVFADGAEQAPTDLDALMATDAGGDAPSEEPAAEEAEPVAVEAEVDDFMQMPEKSW